MITESQLLPVGRLLKPHGINGEITVLLTADVDLASLSCIVLRIDGIFVPFFLNSVRPKSSETDLVTIDGVASDADAARLCPAEVYVLKVDLPAAEADTDGMYASDLLGYDVVENGKMLGKIESVDDTTANYLFIIRTPDGKEVMVPVADEFIAGIDTDTRTISLDLPEGLLDI